VIELNICIFGSSFLPAIGGKEFVMHNLANALVENGHDVTVIAKRVSWEGPQESRNYKLHLYSLPIKGSGRIGLDFISSIFLCAVMHLKKKIDVVNCHSYPHLHLELCRLLLSYLPQVLATVCGFSLSIGG